MNVNRRAFALWLGTVACFSVTMPSARGQAPTLPAQFELNTLSGIYDVPVAMTFCPDGTFFVAEKGGTVQYFDGLGIQATPVLDLRDEVNLNGDRGLLGMTAREDFTPNGGPLSYIYLLYTVSPLPGLDPHPGLEDKYSYSRLTRYRVQTTNGARSAIPSSRQVLLGRQMSNGVVPTALASLSRFHAAGGLAFASDGSLIVSHGDGADGFEAGGLDPAGFEDFVHPVDGLNGPTPQAQDSGAFRAQDLRSLSGKMLRIDPNNGNGYASNPFFDGNVRSNASKIWALGLRNPYRFSLKPGTGALVPEAGQPNTIYSADVGWASWEEINVIRGGENFGWPCYEGPFAQPAYQSLEANQHPQYVYPDCDSSKPGALSLPLLSFTHTVPGSITPSGFDFDSEGQPGGGFTGSCVIGGVHYSGGSYPAEYEDLYFFADWAGRWLKTLETDEQDQLVAVRDFGANVGFTVDIERDPLTGDIYLVTLDPGAAMGTIRRLRFGPNASPVPVVSGGPLRGEPPLWVTLDASASYDPDGEGLSFEWNFGDGSEPATSAIVRHFYEERGTFDLTLTVSDPEQLSTTQHFRLLIWDSPPSARIMRPTLDQPFDPTTLPGGLEDNPFDPYDPSDPTVLPPDGVRESPFDAYNQSIPLLGAGHDPQGGALTFDWNVDLVTPLGAHPSVFQATGQSTSFLTSRSDDGLDYYKVTLSVRAETGATGTDNLFLFPPGRRRDVTREAAPIRELPVQVPVHLVGTLLAELELMSDGDSPKAGSDAPERQFEGLSVEPGSEDWIGYQLAPDQQEHFTGLVFQEGRHRASGGWFENFRVEVRRDGRWHEVRHLRVDPPYPFEQAGQPGFDGEGFNTYALNFEPTRGDAIRLRGAPGGSQRFLSVAELRVMALNDESDAGR